MSKNKTETAVALMTDIHYGKRTSTFNPEICERRVNAIADKIISINSLLTGKYKFDELVIMLPGDVNDGSGIYPTQSHHQEISNPEEQAWVFAEWFAGVVRRLLPHYPRIRIETVPGNHGRTGKHAHEAANWDIVAYKYLGLNLRPDSVPVIIGRGDNLFVRKIVIRRHKYLLFHGHQIRGSFAGIPSYGISQRVCRWATTECYAPFDMAICGHFHAFMHWNINRIPALISGTCVTDDLWSREDLGWESANVWPFFGVSDERPMTWMYPLDAADEKEEEPKNRRSRSQANR